MPVLKKAMKPRQKASRARAARIKRTIRKIDNSLLDPYKYDDYDTNKSQNT